MLTPRDPGLPPTATFDVHFTGSASESYSSNFNLGTNERTENLRTALTPGVSIDINGAFLRGRIVYGLGATTDSSSNEFNLFHSFAGLVEWDATALLKLSVSDTLTTSDEPSQADRLSLRRERRTFTQNMFSANCSYLIDRVSTSLGYGLSTFLGQTENKTTSHTISLSAGMPLFETNRVSLGYEYLRSTTETDRSRSTTTETTTVGLGADASEITGHRLFASFSRQLSAFASAGIAGSYSIRNADQSAGRGSGTFTSWNVSLFNNYTTDTLALSGSLGFSQAAPEDGNVSSSVTSTTALSYRFARVVATVGIDSGFSETFAQGQNAGLVETHGVTAGLSYTFTPAIGGSVAAFYRTNSGVGSSETSNTLGSNLSLTVRLTNWLGLALGYGYTQTSSPSRQSDAALGNGNGYNEHHANISLNASL